MIKLKNGRMNPILSCPPAALCGGEGDFGKNR